MATPSYEQSELLAPWRDYSYDLDTSTVDLKLGASDQDVFRLTRLTPEFSHAAMRGLDPEAYYMVVDLSSLQTDTPRYITLDNTPLPLGQNDTHGVFEFSDHTSNSHVQIYRQESRVLVRDLNSMEGTVAHVTHDSELLDLNHRERMLNELREEFANGITEHDKERNGFFAVGYSKKRRPDTARPLRSNEDSMFFDSSRGIIGVFDGVGEGSESDKASGIANQTAYGYLHQQPRIMGKSEASRVVGKALEMAHDDILNAQLNGSTTGTIVKLCTTPDGDDFAAIGSIGDSRASIIRQGKIVFKTQDTIHPITVEKVLKVYSSVEKYRRVMDEVTDRTLLSRKKRDLFDERHLVGAALGQKPESHGLAEIKVQTVPLKVGDTILVTSDGVHDNLTSSEIQTLAQENPAALLPEALVTRARQRSRDYLHLRAKPDDMTVAVLSYYKKQ